MTTELRNSLSSAMPLVELPLSDSGPLALPLATAGDGGGERTPGSASSDEREGSAGSADSFMFSQLVLARRELGIARKRLELAQKERDQALAEAAMAQEQRS